MAVAIVNDMASPNEMSERMAVAIGKRIAVAIGSEMARCRSNEREEWQVLLGMILQVIANQMSDRTNGSCL